MSLVIGEADLIIKPVSDQFAAQVQSLLSKTQAQFAKNKLPIAFDEGKALKDATLLGDKIAESLAGSLKKFALLSGLGLGIGKVFSTVKGAVIDFNSQLENSRIAFETMTGSAAKANKLIEDFKVLARTTPFEFKDVLAGAQSLIAYQFPLDKLKGTFLAIGDAVAGLGGGDPYKMQLIIRALGQIQAKGRVAGEELLQLQEQGISATRYLAEGFGVTTAELSKMQQKGLVPAGAAIDFIISGLQKDFGGLMEKQSKNLITSFSNFRDGLTQVLSTIGKPIYDVFKNIVFNASNFVAQLSVAFNEGGFTGEGGVFEFLVGKAPESARATITSILNSLSSITESAKKLLPALVSVGGEFAKLGGGAVVGGFRALLAVVAPLLETVANNITVFKDFVRVLLALYVVQKLTAMMNAFSTSMRSGAIADNVSGISKRVAGLGVVAGQATAKMKMLNEIARSAGTQTIAGTAAVPQGALFGGSGEGITSSLTKVEKLKEGFRSLGVTARASAGAIGAALAVVSSQTGGVVDNLAGIGAGAATGFAVAGPWGAAIGAGFGFLQGYLNDAAERTAKLKEAAKEVSEEYKKIISVEVEARNKASANPLAQQANLESIKTATQSDIDDYNKLIAERDKLADEARKKQQEQLAATPGRRGFVADAGDVIIKQFESQVNVARAKFDTAQTLQTEASKELARTIDASKKVIVDAYSEASPEIQSALQKFLLSAQPSLDDLNPTLTGLAKSLNTIPGIKIGNKALGVGQADPELIFKAVAASQKLQEQFKELTGQEFEASAGIDVFSAALAKISPKEVVAVSSSLDDLLKSVTTLATKGEAFGKAWSEGFGKVFSSQEAYTSAIGALNKLNDTIATSDSSVTDLRSVLEGSTDAWLNYVQAALSIGKDANEIDAVYQQWIDQIMATGVQAGYSKDQLKLLYDQVLGLKNTTIEIKVKLDKAQEAFDQLQKLQELGTLGDPELLKQRRAELSILKGEFEKAVKGAQGADQGAIRAGVDANAAKKREDAQKAIEKAQKEAADAAQRAGEAAQKAAEEAQKASQRMADALKGLQQSFADTAKSIVNKAQEFIGSATSKLQLNPGVNVSRLLKNTDFRTSAIKEFTSGRDELKKRGLSDSALQSLGITGPESVKQIRKLLAADPAQLGKLSSSLNSQRDSAIQAAAKTEGELIAKAVSDALERYFSATDRRPGDLTALRDQIVFQVSSNASNPEAVASAIIAQVEGQLQRA
jgi:tape measure domain-containing protein